MTAACRDWVPLHPRRLRDEATLAQRLASVAQQMDEGGRRSVVVHAARQEGPAGRATSDGCRVTLLAPKQRLLRPAAPLVEAVPWCPGPYVGRGGPLP